MGRPSVVHPVTLVVELSTSWPRYGLKKVQNSEESGVRLSSTRVHANVIQQSFLWFKQTGPAPAS